MQAIYQEGGQETVDIPKESKAVVLEKYNRPLTIHRFPVPEVEPGGMLVGMEIAGICGTVVHQRRGDLGFKPTSPVVPGHETAGRIEVGNL